MCVRNTAPRILCYIQPYTNCETTELVWIGMLGIPVKLLEVSLTTFWLPKAKDPIENNSWNDIEIRDDNRSSLRVTAPTLYNAV